MAIWWSTSPPQAAAATTTMRPLLLLLLLVSCLFAPSSVLATTPTTCNLPANDCPFGRAETGEAFVPLGRCSYRGDCVYSACSCYAGWGDEDCSRPLKPIRLGALTITQAALDEAPTRYSDIVTDTFTAFVNSNVEIAPVNMKQCREYIFKTPLVPRWDINFALDYPSVKLQIINGGVRVSAEVQVSIPRIALDVYVSQQPTVLSCCDRFEDPIYLPTVNCSRACTTAQGDYISLDFKMRLQANVYPSISPLTSQVEIDVPDQELVFDLVPADLGFDLSCNLAAYPALLNAIMQSYVTNWGLVLNTQFTQAFRDTTALYADQFSDLGSREFDASNYTKIKAVAKSIAFHADSHLVMVLDGYVRSQRHVKTANSACPKVYSYFVDSNYDERDLPVPMDFDGFSERAASPQVVLQTTAMGRVSRSAVKAAYWVAMLDQNQLVQDYTSTRANATALDAHYLGRIDWAKPVISFPISNAANSSVRTTNTLRITVPNGQFNLECTNTREIQAASVFARTTFDAYPMSLGNFSNVLGHSSNSAEFWFTAQVYTWDVSHFNMNFSVPETMSVPNALARLAFTRLLSTRLPTANEMLRDNAMLMPNALARFAPGPRIQARHDWDNHGADWGNGYLEFTTRCACVTTAGAGDYVTVQTANFGQELVPRCTTPCSAAVLAAAGRRVLEEEEEEAASAFPMYEELQTAWLHHLHHHPASSSVAAASPPNQQQRRQLLTSSSPQLNRYTSSGRCGPRAAVADVSLLRAELSKLLTCATNKDYFSFSRSAVPYQCLRELEPELLKGSCDAASSSLFRNFSQCALPLDMALPLVFNKQCGAGPYFDCSMTVQQLYEQMCHCSQGSDFTCSEEDTAWLVIAIAVGFTVVAWILIPLGLCVVSGSTFRRALTLRVKMRTRDAWTTLLSLLASVALFGGTFGWISEDPIRSFTKQIVNSDLFKASDYVQSDFSSFMVVWSMIALFFMAMCATQLLVFALASIAVGRSVWLFPVAQYEREGTTFAPSEYLMKVWRGVATWTMGSIRIQVFVLIVSFASPPMFYSFKSSVVVREPQFGWIEHGSLGENLTSLATAPETLNMLKQVVGFSLMSAGMGFVSSGLVFVLHGAAPGCFAAAQCMIFYINRKETRDRELFSAYGNLLPPPDNSELDRWRRIIYLFMWCVHVAGAMGSAVAAIIMYQAMRAPSGWAISWILCWVATVPCLLAGTDKSLESRPFVNVILAVAYTGLFLVLTIIMLYYSPGKAGFSVWFGGLLLGAIFILTFFFLLSEFVNIAQRIMGETQIVDQLAQQDKIRLMQKMGVDVTKTPELLGQDFHWNQGAATAASGGGGGKGGGMMLTSSAGNPLFDVERKRVADSQQQQQQYIGRAVEDGGRHGGGRAAAAAGPADDVDLLKLMASRSKPTDHQEHQTNMRHADAMARAADKLQNRARMSLARPISPVNGAPHPDFAPQQQQQQQQPAPSSSSSPRLPPVPDRVNKPTMDSFNMNKRSPSSMSAAASPSLSAAAASASPSSPSLAPRSSPRPQQPQQQPPPQPPVMYLDTSAAMSRAQNNKEAERLKRRISKRLAARGVKGDQAKELTERIALFHTMKMVNEASTYSPRNGQQQRAMPNKNTYNAPSNNNNNNINNNNRIVNNTNNNSSHRIAHAGSSSSLVLNPKQSPQLQQQPGSSMTRGGSYSSMAAPPGSSQYKQSPGLDMTPQDSKQQRTPMFVKDTAYASAQATEVTNNAKMDDAYARQFEPGYKGNQLAWDGDDSFFSFGKELGRQAIGMVKSLRWLLSKQARQDFWRSRARVDNNNSDDAPAKEYSPPTLRGVLRGIWDIIFETRELKDSATYGLRIPYRRLVFFVGLCLMFVLMVYTTMNRISVQRLKNMAFRLAVSGMEGVDFPDEVYDFPSVGNLSTIVDAPLEQYIDQANIAFNLLWAVWAIWVVSFVVEITYSNFGRDMEEKRQGIKYARWMSLFNLPLLLIVVVIPCVPDYVGLAIPNFYNVIPVCATRFDAFLVTIAADVFGVLAGAYLTFQTLVVVVLISPAFARALFFVVVREVRELRQLNTFEPRKRTMVTRKRLQNARFVWKVAPLMSPVITFLPLLLVTQLLGKMYASILVFVFMGSPVITGMFKLRTDTDDQRVLDWMYFISVWESLYAAPIVIIIVVEALDRGQVSYLIQQTLGNWTFYVKIMSEVLLAIVVTGDLLYIFMSSDEELEADVVINEYLDALNEEAAAAEVAPAAIAAPTTSRANQQVDARDRHFTLEV